MKFFAPTVSTAAVAKVPLVRVLRGLQEQLHTILFSCEEAESQELTGMIMSVERLAWQVHAAQSVLAAEANHRTANLPVAETLAHEYGCASVYEYLQRCTLMSRRGASTRINLGRSLRAETSLIGAPLEADLPYLALAVRAGAISPESTKMIANMLKSIPWVKADKRDRAERALVEAATGIDFATGTLKDIEEQQKESGEPNLLTGLADQGLLNPLGMPDTDEGSESETGADDDEGSASREVFPALAQHADSLRTMTKTWEQYLDQDGTQPSEKETLKARGFNLGRLRRGLVPVTGNLLPEVAAPLDGLMDSIDSPRNQKSKANNDSAAADTGADGERTGLWSEGPDVEGRTPSHKRHDALAAIINVASTAAEIPNHGGAPATVLVETSQEALETGETSWMMGPGSQTTPLTPQALGMRSVALRYSTTQKTALANVAPSSLAMEDALSPAGRDRAFQATKTRAADRQPGSST